MVFQNNGDKAVIESQCNGSKFSSVFALFVLLLSSTLEKLRWNIGGWGCDLFTITTIIAFFFIAISNQRIKFEFYTKKILKYYVVYYIYLIIMTFTLFDNNAAAVQHAKGLIVTFVSILCFINIVMITDKRNGITYKDVSSVFFAVAMVNNAYCIIQQLLPNFDDIIVSVTKSDVPRYGLEAYGPLYRVSGSFIDPNFTGPFLVISLINSIYLLNLVDKSSRKKRLIYIFAIIITIANIFLTFSRTAYLGLVVFFVFYFLAGKKTEKFKILILCVIVVMGIVYIYTTNDKFRLVLSARFNFLLGSSSVTNDDHFEIAIQALQIIFSNIGIFLFGTGLNSMYLYFQEKFNYVKKMKCHNHFLQVFGETGLIGFVMYIYFLKLLFIPTKSNNSESRILRSMLITMISMNFTYDPLCRNFCMILLALAIALNSANRASTIASSEV